MTNAHLILALLVNLSLSIKSPNIKKSLTLMLSISVIMTQEKTEINIAKAAFFIHKLFSA
jgi:hypothetical protein